MRSKKVLGDGWAHALAVKYQRIITFAGVGVLNTLVDFLAFTLAVNLLTASVEVCQSIGYFAGILNSFVFNRKFTFKKGTTTRLGAQVTRFVVVNGMTYLLSVWAIHFLNVDWNVNVYVSKLVVTALVMVVNYLGYKIFVFGIQDAPKD